MAEKKPNILFLLIDSFNSRNCFGNEKTSITPNIDSLISNGVYFDQVITCASTTVPSICSMFTGTYPFDATVLDGNHYKLNTKIQNFVSILEKNGYMFMKWNSNHRNESYLKIEPNCGTQYLKKNSTWLN